MLSRFPSVTEHVSSKLSSPVNCLNSPIYTSQYLARVLLPCQFSLHSSLLPVNYFLVLPSHPNSLIHFGFIAELHSLSLKDSSDSIHYYILLWFLADFTAPSMISSMHMFTQCLWKQCIISPAGLYWREEAEILAPPLWDGSGSHSGFVTCCPFCAGPFEHILLFHLMDLAFKSPLSCFPEI